MRKGCVTTVFLCLLLGFLTLLPMPSDAGSPEDILIAEKQLDTRNSQNESINITSWNDFYSVIPAEKVTKQNKALHFQDNQQPAEVETIPATSDENMLGNESAIDPDMISAPEPAPASESVPTSDLETAPDNHIHNYKITVTASTCSHDGYTLYECTCGDTYKDSTQERLNHNYISETVPSTTETSGYTLYTCSECGTQYKSDYTDPLPKESATEETSSAINTCGRGTPETEDYGFCPDCGLRIWTTWYTTGCFTFLEDTVCDCGDLVHAGECHHH